MATLAQLGIALTGLQTDVKHVTHMVNGLTLKLKPALGPTYKCSMHLLSSDTFAYSSGRMWLGSYHYSRYCPQDGSPQIEPGSSSSPVFESARSLSPHYANTYHPSQSQASALPLSGLTARQITVKNVALNLRSFWVIAVTCVASLAERDRNRTI